MITYQLLLRRQHLRPPILLTQLHGHISSAMLLQTSLHAIDATPSHLQPSMNRRRVEARLEQLLDLLLHLRRLFAGAGHFCFCLNEISHEMLVPWVVGPRCLLREWCGYLRVGKRRCGTGWKRGRSWRWDCHCQGGWCRGFVFFLAAERQARFTRGKHFSISCHITYFTVSSIRSLASPFHTLISCSLCKVKLKCRTLRLSRPGLPSYPLNHSSTPRHICDFYPVNVIYVNNLLVQSHKSFN